ncbi:MAG TPA: glycosyltransferase [bacterium]
MNNISGFERYLLDPESLRAVSEATDLPTGRARNGQPSLSFRGIRLHSQGDPQAEAELLLESARGELDAALAKSVDEPVTCLIYGAGLGYLIQAICAYAPEGRIRIVCLEADAEVARKALQLRVWEPCNVPVSWVVGAGNRDGLKHCGNTANAVVFKLTPGYRANKAVYAEWLTSLDARVTAGRPMRILVPTPLYGGSLPIAFHCAEAFRELGHTVDVLDLSPWHPQYKAIESVTTDARHRKVLQGMYATYLSELIAARALDWNADLVWAVAQTPLTAGALDEMRHEGIHTALWFVEDSAVFGYWRELASHFDAVFSIQRGKFHDELKAVGAKHVHYLPCAANPAVHYPLNLSEADQQRFGSDVSFVGAGYANRQTLFAQLALKNFKIWGADWPAQSPASVYVQEEARRVTPEETAAIYAATKVNLNLHSSPHHAGVNPFGDYVNPRTFEIAACGGFQLVDSRSELAELFEAGKEIAVFKDAAEIPELVNHYLANPDQREQMAACARERVLKEHTYTHRLSGALSFLESRFRKLAERKRGPNYVSSLKQAAGDDEELLAFLSAFSDEEEIDLDKIVSRIEVGKGELTRTEGIFLLMKEFRDWGREKGVIQ